MKLYSDQHQMSDLNVTWGIVAACAHALIRQIPRAGGWLYGHCRKERR